MQELEQKINKAIEGKVPCNGRPIMLNHVLKYLRVIEECTMWHINSAFMFQDSVEPYITEVFWNMESVLLSDQSYDVKQFLLDL